MGKAVRVWSTQLPTVATGRRAMAHAYPVGSPAATANSNEHDFAVGCRWHLFQPCCFGKRIVRQRDVGVTAPQQLQGASTPDGEHLHVNPVSCRNDGRIAGSRPEFSTLVVVAKRRCGEGSAQPAAIAADTHRASRIEMGTMSILRAAATALAQNRRHGARRQRVSRDASITSEAAISAQPEDDLDRSVQCLSHRERSCQRIRCSRSGRLQQSPM